MWTILFRNIFGIFCFIFAVQCTRELVLRVLAQTCLILPQFHISSNFSVWNVKKSLGLGSKIYSESYLCKGFAFRKKVWFMFKNWHSEGIVFSISGYTYRVCLILLFVFNDFLFWKKELVLALYKWNGGPLVLVGKAGGGGGGRGARKKALSVCSAAMMFA